MANNNGHEHFLPASGITPAGNETTGKWTKMQQPEAFINNLETLEVNPEQRNLVFNTLIAGVPSPWARAKVTYFALQQDDNDDQRALMSCYRALRDEWRGLIATLVCRSDQFYLSKPIHLPHFDDEELQNVRVDELSILSTYGDMLFKEMDLWFQEEAAAGRRRDPAIQFLYFKDQGQNILVGATSPFTIFFTSVNYSIRNANGVTGISDDGKFQDPTKDPAKTDEQRANYRKIYTFIKRLQSNLTNYKANLRNITDANSNNDKDDLIEKIYQTLVHELDLWTAQIARNLGVSLSVLQSEPAEPLNLNDNIVPKGPLSVPFVNDQKFKWSGEKFVVATPEEADQIVAIDSLFSDSGFLTVWTPVQDKKWIEKYEKAPVHYIKATDKDGRTVFLALPFSAKGIQTLGKNIAGILAGTDENVAITAEIKGDVVDIRLSMRVNDPRTGVRRNSELLLKTYTMIPGTDQHHAFTWPNFKSIYWDQYYYYSELPANVPNTTRAIPEFEGKEFDKPNAVPTFEDLKAVKGIDYKVTFPVGSATNDMPRYEVISSDTPLHYITLVDAIEGRDQVSGRLLVKVDAPQDQKSMRTIPERPQNKAYVGIDFGSTNTCAYYRLVGTDEPKPLPFSNMRLAIMNFDNDPGRLAKPNELLFISNEEPLNNNGQVKSWLHRHHHMYVDSARMNEALIGGVPVNETNIVVADMTDTQITTNAGLLSYNMKWLTGAEGQDRNSFLRMLWLHISADLFRKGIEPVEIRWSYPGAQENPDIALLFNKCQFFPKAGNDKSVKNASFTEAEAVCRHAGKAHEPGDRDLTLGIDIGGSTSDILILGKEPGEQPCLYSQCSVRLAAGKFFSAIKNSRAFREALVQFHNSGIVKGFTEIPVEGIGSLVGGDNSKRAPYYLNNIFDRLNKGESMEMYHHMRSYVPFVFTLPSFVTGLLCYYSGQLLRAAIVKNGLDQRPEPVDNITVQYFGKGGRLFEWLYACDRTLTEQYLCSCIYAGMGDKAIRNISIIWPEQETENKTEVARGLVLMGEGKRYLGIKNDTGDGASANPFGGFGDDIFGAAPGASASSGGVESMGHDVIGEKGIRYYKDGAYHTLSEDDELGDLKVSQLNFSECKNENFSAFVKMFAAFLVKAGFVDQATAKTLWDKAATIQIGTFLANNDSSSESARMPIFVAEGLYFLEKVLLPTAFNK